MCHICDALDASTARCVGSKSTEVTEVKGSFLNFNHEKMSLPLTLCKDNIKKKTTARVADMPTRAIVLYFSVLNAQERREGKEEREVESLVSSDFRQWLKRLPVPSPAVARSLWLMYSKVFWVFIHVTHTSGAN